VHMDRKDASLAIDLFYDQMGWDRATGAPTAATYRKFGLSSIAAELGRRNLLPSPKAKRE